MTVQSGCPGIAGVLVPNNQPWRNAFRSCPETRDASAMKSSVDAERPRNFVTHARSMARNAGSPIYWRRA
jgi:hypothetical protein